MSRTTRFRPPLTFLFGCFLLPVTGAFAATLTIPVVSGTITYSTIYLPDWTEPTFNLVTVYGTVTGFTPAYPDFPQLQSPPFPFSVTASLGFAQASLLTGPTNLLITTPDPVYITDDGICCDIADGLLSAPTLFTVPAAGGTFSAPFSLQLTLSDRTPPGVPFNENDYILTGTGIATLVFGTNGQFGSATYTFNPVPEPSTIYLLAGALAVAVFRYRRKAHQ